VTGMETKFTHEGTSLNMAGIRVSLASTERWNIRSVGSLASSAVPAGCVLLLLLSGFDTSAQQPAPRITGEISNASRSTVAGSHPPATRSMHDSGQVPSNTQLQGMSVVLSRTPAQETALQSLIAAQQDPSSTQYHQWYTPDQFAARFAVADSDIAQVESWLQQQGFAINGVSRSKNRITFSGNVGQVDAAFGTEIHNYTSGQRPTLLLQRTSASRPL
jgi:hypothetical protein